MLWGSVAVILISSFATVLIALAALHWFAPRETAQAAPGCTDAVFLFDDERLVDVSPAAQALLDQIRGPGSEWSRLLAYLEPRFPRIEAALAALASQRRLRLEAENGPALVLEAEWRAGVARITLADPLVEGPAPLDRLSLRAQEEELAILREVVEGLTTPIWREDADGTVTWASPAYLEHCGLRPEEAAWPLPRLFERPVPHPSIAGTLAGPRRVSLPGGPGGRPRWYEFRSRPQGGGELCFAEPVTALVQAETSLREFLQTLGKTFAELPIGLAIFDRSRKLQLFNPALSDLTNIGAEMLLARPSLFAFLDRLRENRMMPERKDYATWRQQMVALEQAAVSGQYEETWNLPTGQTYRVTGRPHPDGAVALLLEDISAEISLTRRFRAELELGQEVLDSLPQAVAVFSSAGQMLVSNAAYLRGWDGEAGTALCAPGIGEALRRWQAICGPDPAWAQVQNYVLTLGERPERSFTLNLAEGRVLRLSLCPIAGGATVVSFEELEGDDPRPLASSPRTAAAPLALPGV